MALKKGTGSKPIQGNISNNQIHIILAKQTLTDWKNSSNYRAGLYWLLKSITKQELLEFKEKSKEFTNL